MTHVLTQLNRWRLMERVIRFLWGGARVLAVALTVLAVACLLDYLIDRYRGSESWRTFLRKTWVFAPKPAEPGESWATDVTPLWFRFLMSAGQAALAGWLAWAFVIRPLRRTPLVDDLAFRAEKAIPEFDHRLVTAVQLNRAEARTQGMSQHLIAELTREAGEIATKHNLLSLVDYRRVGYALAVAVPVLALWGAFFALKPALAGALVQRQLLLGGEIPRTTFLKNVTQDVWPTGAEVDVRYFVTGEWDETAVGRIRVQPTGQPEEYYDLKFERAARADDTDGAYFVTRLPASSTDFGFAARLVNGRTRDAGFVRFEAPPQANEVEAWQLLPRFVGTKTGEPNGPRFVRQNEGSKRGEVVDVLPGASVRVVAQFSKPLTHAALVPVERDGPHERFLKPVEPLARTDDRMGVEWEFATTPKTIGYKLEVADDRGFANAVPIRRNVRMLDDKPPSVVFLPESTRHPDPKDFDGAGDPRVYEWGDKLPLAEGGRVMVLFHARSEQAIGRAAIRYRVLPKGVPFDQLPAEWQKVNHPADDPEAKVFARLLLKPTAYDPKKDGPYVTDLGLFERSWDGLTGLKRGDRMKKSVEFYAFPSTAPGVEPAALEAGGRYMFEIDGLTKLVPDKDNAGKFVSAKLELGDTVELYVEAYDKNPAANRAPGFTREARRKIVVSGDDAALAIRMRDEQNKKLQDKLRDLAADQAGVFKVREEPKK
jgi:hypothetical protein